MPPAAPHSGDERFSRQQLFAPIGPEGQKRLHDSRVLVVGCGALGSHAAEHLVRAGVGHLRLVDRDIVEWSNLHRQVGYTEDDAQRGRPKATALAAHLRRLRGDAVIDAETRQFDFANALDLAEGCHVFLDGSDNLPTRFLLNDLSYKLGVPWIYAGAIADSAHAQFFSGTSGPCLRCQLPELPPPGSLPTCDTAGVIAPAAAVAASFQVAWALRFLVERNADGLARRKSIVRLWSPEARVVHVDPDPGCSVCVHGRFDTLAGERRERAAVLCGRDTVQVLPAAVGASVDFEQLAARLAALGHVERLDGLLRLRSPTGYTLTIFDDGRALFSGLTDPGQARNLYARFVGQ